LIVPLDGGNASGTSVVVVSDLPHDVTIGTNPVTVVQNKPTRITVGTKGNVVMVGSSSDKITVLK
jgi:hypothetical protein